MDDVRKFTEIKSQVAQETYQVKQTNETLRSW